MAIYRNKATGDLVDAWMHSTGEDSFTVAFPNWLHALWESGGAYTDAAGKDWLKTASGDVEIPDGHYILRQAGGVMSIAAPDAINGGYRFEA